MRGRRPFACAGAERGFTLIEALVALVILGAASVGAVAALGGGLRSQAGLDRHLAAVALAEWRLAELELLPRDSLGAYGEGRSGPFPPPFSDYHWEARAGVAAGAPPDVFDAVVRVAWRGGSYEVATSFYRPDPLPRALRPGP